MDYDTERALLAILADNFVESGAVISERVFYNEDLKAVAHFDGDGHVRHIEDGWSVRVTFDYVKRVE